MQSRATGIAEIILPLGDLIYIWAKGLLLSLTQIPDHPNREILMSNLAFVFQKQEKDQKIDSLERENASLKSKLQERDAKIRELTMENALLRR